VRRFDATTSRAKPSLPQDVETVTIPRAGETMVWLPDPGALVPGDRLLGDDRGGLRMCPPGWLRYLEPGLSYEELREELRSLLELPVEMVLVSHGKPVLQGGRAAIERALS
jgi:glyoxylase-like metal-dependent hydrolase (beta-lactamase superfamily II)